MEKRTKKQWLKTFLVGLFLPLFILWELLYCFIDVDYSLSEKLKYTMDKTRTKILSVVYKFIWGEDF